MYIGYLYRILLLWNGTPDFISRANEACECRYTILEIEGKFTMVAAESAALK